MASREELNSMLEQTARKRAEADIYDGLHDKMAAAASYAARCTSDTYELESEANDDSVRVNEIAKLLTTADRMSRRYGRRADDLRADAYEDLMKARKIAKDIPDGEELLSQQTGFEFPDRWSHADETELDGLYRQPDKPSVPDDGIELPEEIRSKEQLRLNHKAMAANLRILSSFVMETANELQRIGLDDPTAGKEYRNIARLCDNTMKSAEKCDDKASELRNEVVDLWHEEKKRRKEENNAGTHSNSDPDLHQKAVEKYFEDDGEWLRQMNGFTEDAYQNFSDVMNLVGLDYDYDFDYFSPCSGITIKDPYWGYASHLRPIEDDELYGEYQYDLQKIWNEELEKIEDRLTDDDDEECAPEFFRAVGDRWFDFVRSECDWYMTDEAAKEWLSSNDISDDESLRAFIGDQDSDSGKPGIFSRAVGAVTSGIRSISETVNEATAKPANPFGGDASVSSGKGHEGKPMVDGYEYVNKNGKVVHVDSYKNPRYRGPRR